MKFYAVAVALIAASSAMRLERHHAHDISDNNLVQAGGPTLKLGGLEKKFAKQFAKWLRFAVRQEDDMTWEDAKDLLQQEAEEKGIKWTPEYMADQKKIFDQIDTDKNGIIEVKELEAWDEKQAAAKAAAKKEPATTPPAKAPAAWAWDSAFAIIKICYLFSGTQLSKNLQI